MKNKRCAFEKILLLFDGLPVFPEKSCLPLDGTLLIFPRKILPSSTSLLTMLFSVDKEFGFFIANRPDVF